MDIVCDDQSCLCLLCGKFKLLEIRDLINLLKHFDRIKGIHRPARPKLEPIKPSSRSHGTYLVGRRPRSSSEERLFVFEIPSVGALILILLLSDQRESENPPANVYLYTLASPPLQALRGDSIFTDHCWSRRHAKNGGHTCLSL